MAETCIVIYLFDLLSLDTVLGLLYMTLHSALRYVQWCVGKCLTASSGVGTAWFIEFADFHGVNTPTVFYFKPPTWSHFRASWEERRTVCSPQREPAPALLWHTLHWAQWSPSFTWLWDEGQSMCQAIRRLFVSVLEKSVEGLWEEGGGLDLLEAQGSFPEVLPWSNF